MIKTLTNLNSSLSTETKCCSVNNGSMTIITSSSQYQLGDDSYEYNAVDKWATAGHLLVSVFAGPFSYLFVLYKI